jgi:hypothetical protein
MPSISIKRYDRPAAARFCTEELGCPVTKATLAKLAVIGGGPLFSKFGRKPLYTEGDLRDWVDSKLSAPVRSTSELRAAGHAVA